MVGVLIPLILVLGVIVLIVVVAIQRSTKKGDSSGDGADIIPYLVLALSMGVAGFALTELASTAFPGETFVFDPADELATSLSALVVSTPFLVYFWRRQAQRRATYPESPGWTLYLALIELVFLPAFMITAVLFVNGVLTNESASAWTGVLVFGAIMVFHEYAARVTPPLSDAGELRRVFGSAISLITATAGLTGVFGGLLASLYASTGDFVPVDPGFHPWVAMTLVGLPIWWYRWLRPWDTTPAAPRLTWAVIASVTSLAVALGSAAAISVQIVEYLLTETPPAGQHFDSVPVTLALIIVAVPTWFIHGRDLEDFGGNPIRVYRYAMAALGLVTAVSTAVALTTVAFDRSLIVGGETGDIVALTVVLLVGLLVWLVFERRAGTDAITPAPWPLRLYTLGVGVVFGLVAAGALITTLFILLRRILDGTGTGSLLEPGTLFLYTGLAAWYLLGTYMRVRVTSPAADVVVPFDVTIVCSHPGQIAARFPEEATLRVLYRADDLGVIGEDMANDIVAAVDNRSSFVWVDEEGFRIAPLRAST